MPPRPALGCVSASIVGWGWGWGLVPTASFEVHGSAVLHGHHWGVRHSSHTVSYPFPLHRPFQHPWEGGYASGRLGPLLVPPLSPRKKSTQGLFLASHTFGGYRFTDEMSKHLPLTVQNPCLGFNTLPAPSSADTFF